MAEKDKKVKSGGKGKKPNKLLLPTKRTINLATVGEKRTNYTLLAGELVLGLVVIALALKFGVYDRLSAMYKAEREAAEVRHQVNTLTEEIDSYGDLNDLYAHYTYSGMTEEELTRVDRLDVMEMITRVILPQSSTASWSISADKLNLSIKSDSLEEINSIAKQLEQEPIVDYCTVSTASTGAEEAHNIIFDTHEYIGEQNVVTANVTVYLTSEKEAED